MPDRTVQPDGTVVDPTRTKTEETTDEQTQQTATPGASSNLTKLALLLGA